MEIFGHVPAGPASKRPASLLDENRDRGWKAVDPSCPPHILQRILEFRSKHSGVAQPPAPRDLKYLPVMSDAERQVRPAWTAAEEELRRRRRDLLNVVMGQ